MSRREWRHRIADILAAIDSIDRYRAGLSLDALQTDARTFHAILFNLVIIGEAAGSVPDDVQRSRPDIPGADMRAMRNFIAHGYFAVSPTIVWETITKDLPPLVAPLRAMLPS